MAISNAIPQGNITRVIGYELNKAFFQTATQNLPQRIVVLAEADTSHIGSIDPSVPFEFTTALEVANAYGYGSPAYQIARILRPSTGGGVGAIPTVLYPQDTDVAATPTITNITATGTATGNATHYLEISGRRVLDGKLLSINVQTGDTPDMIATKISDLLASFIQTPLTAATTPTLGVDCTTKWSGASSNELSIEVFTDGAPVGVTYAVNVTQNGVGDVSVAASLADFGSTWNTLVVNQFSDSTNLDLIEAANGVPDPTATGRYVAEIWKPFISLFGNTDSTLASIKAITDTTARKAEVTNALCPAPNSMGYTWEAAANVGAMLAPVWQNTPHLDVSGQTYPDMPTAINIGDFGTYNGREAIVKSGSSTVDLKNGAYQVQEIVTTYHPDGEEPAQFRYVRNLMIDFNVKYGLDLKEQMFVIDHMIAENEAVVTASKVIKPKQWKQIIISYVNDLVNRGIIVDADFTIDSILVGISETNPDRLDTSFSYKRSNYARVVSTSVDAGFSFGSSSN